MKAFLQRNRYALLFGYFVLYLFWFRQLELHAVPMIYTHCSLDNLIPFCAWFIIPYFLWFPYVGIAMGTVYIKSKSEFCHFCASLFSGMTICLVIYTFWPSGQLLRPELSGELGVFHQLVQQLYQMDSPTNVCPSIHVYNTLCVHHLLCTWEQTRNIKWLTRGSTLLMILIIASTVLLKQHSVVDGIAAVALWIVIELVLQWVYLRQKQRQLHRLSI